MSMLSLKGALVLKNSRGTNFKNIFLFIRQLTKDEKVPGKVDENRVLRPVRKRQNLAIGARFMLDEATM